MIRIITAFTVCAALFAGTAAQAQQAPDLSGEIGDELKLIPLTEPMVPPQRVVEWMAPILPGLYKFDHSNFRERVQASSQHFTEDGFADFVSGLRESVEVLVQQQLASDARLNGPVVLLRAGEVEQASYNESRRYAWILGAPIELAYGSAEAGIRSTKFQAQMVVVRVPWLVNSRGFLLQSINLTPIPEEEQETPEAEPAEAVE